ncbi:alpha/beta fold family hydrolase [Nitzschia inconspicua]|uniref:Alpha/beta fold family hydrolase n=1 Tax=Nitzschia inconspicua TaxID=303405 RepID=A0A9K3PYX4_9STRA|nr:alpha/beta fold family hydrolase [Nitzschia inconspicua]
MSQTPIISTTFLKGIHFTFLDNVNGIRHRVASTRPNLTISGPLARQQGHELVLFLHGFPESWYSWRYQLLLLRDRPYLPVAPDMRGFGATSQPRRTEDYTQTVIAKDVVEIAKALGYNEFIVVGHDWGCQAAWSVSLLYPQHVLGVLGMSAPYTGTPRIDMLSFLQSKYGPCLDESIPAKERERKCLFHYMLHHCLAKSTEEYDKNGREFLYRIYTNRKGCETVQGTPEYDIHGNMFDTTGRKTLDEIDVLDATVAPGMWKRLPRAKTLPNWLKEEDPEYLTKEYEQAGFHGGLSWYRAMKLNFEAVNAALRRSDGSLDDKISPPSLFIIGEDDSLVDLYGGRDKIIHRLNGNMTSMTRKPIFIKDVGHWIQVEAKDAVNEALLQFLEDVAMTHRMCHL